MPERARLFWNAPVSMPRECGDERGGDGVIIVVSPSGKLHSIEEPEGPQLYTDCGHFVDTACWSLQRLDTNGVRCVKCFPEVEQEESPMGSRFQHAPSFTRARGAVRVTCCCGWPGSKHADEGAAQAAYDKHVGLRERPSRRPGPEIPVEMMDEQLLTSVFYPGLYH